MARIDQFLSLLDLEPRTWAVSVLVASRDEAELAQLAPTLAKRLWPGGTFGRVLHHEPHPAPESDDPELAALFASRDWSVVDVEELPTVTSTGGPR